MTRLVAGCAVLSLTAALLAGCGGDDGPRAVTSDEAQMLAQARFRNYDLGARAVSTTVDDDSGTVTLDGWVDFVDHVGYAHLDQEGSAASLVSWDGTSAALVPSQTATAPLPPPETLAAAPRSPLDASTSTEQALLLVMLDLGSDRPENPLLLQQDGAQWLRSDDVDGTPVGVFTATADGHARYWMDHDGLMQRVEVLVGGDWETVDLGDALDPDQLGALVEAS